MRSAFTYCEGDIPSRIDLGKMKYGGPFTTEQVEDVKTLFRVLFIVFMIAAICGAITEQYSIQSYFTELFMLENSAVLNGIVYNFYYVAGTILVPMNEVFICPLFNHCLHLKSYWKCLLGVVLYVGRYLLLIILLTYTR